MAYKYKDYTQSDGVTKAQAAVDAQQAAKPEQYVSGWQNQLDRTMESIMGRKDFQYDLNGDALYQQYKQQAIKNGRLAMMDTMGQASAMTGGYGNSYAQSVGQQAYQQHMTDLNDKIPQLYQLALDRYDMETNRLYNQYGLLADRENLDYSRYRDQLGDWQGERNYLAGRLDTERNLDLDRYYTDRSFDQSVWADAQQRALAQVQWYLDNGKEPPAELVELADLDSRYVEDLLKSKNVPSSGGGGSSRTSTPQVKVDTNSVLNLGYGPVSADKLADLVADGKVNATSDGNKITFSSNTQKTTTTAPSISKNSNPYTQNPNDLLLKKVLG